MAEEKAKQADEYGIVQTGIDRLLSKVYANKSIKLRDAAKQLGLAEDQAEEWANILADHELVDIRYSPLAGMILQSKPGKAYDDERGVYDLPSEKKEDE